MGNRLTFLFFCLSIIFLNQNVFADSDCGAYADRKYEGLGEDFIRCECKYSNATGTKGSESFKEGATPGPEIQSAMNNMCPKQDSAQKCDEYSTPQVNEKGVVDSCLCKYGLQADSYKLSDEYDPNYCPKSDKCPANSEPFDNSRSCRCKYLAPGDSKNIEFSFYGAVWPVCPLPPSTNMQNSSCINKLADQIKKCSEQAQETMNICSDKEESNSKIKGVVNSISSQIAALQSGGADSCRKAGFLSSTAGYGIGLIRQNCEKEITACEDSCNGLRKYTEISEIEKECHSELIVSAPVGTAAREQFLAKAQELSELMAIAESDCASNQKQTNAEKFLETSKRAVQTYVSSSAQAAKCAAMLSGKAEILPLNLDCALSGGVGANCPVNCISNPGDASCKVLGVPGLAQIALPGNGKPAIGNTIGGLKTTKGDLGNLDLSGGSGDGVSNGTLPQAGDNSSGVFGTAAAAQAGGGGSTGEGPGKDGKDKPGAEGTEEKGFFGGTFSAMKNAASSFFGGGSGSRGSYGKNSSSQNNKTISELNKKNSILRGVANAGQKCYYDAKGAEYCFGRPNMDIFKMINIRYNMNDNSFLKGNGG